MTEKVTIRVNHIKSANNAKTFKNVYKGTEIITNNVNVENDDIVSIKGSDDAKAYLERSVRNFQTKDGAQHNQLQLKIGKNLNILNASGDALELSGNLENTNEANIILSYGVDSKFGNEYVRVNAIVMNVQTADEVPVHKEVVIDDSDLFAF